MKSGNRSTRGGRAHADTEYGRLFRTIYLLMSEKGYARVSDIAEHLGVHPSSVTKMVQKLDREGIWSMKNIVGSC